ncbi:ran guanine nucleotide release factor, putative [Actinidia rufa]|uniref:Ran guanine nucleotide release factor, putative n=1 Tax=Actinidia rufa TaxID=165716 RepID=A0A7J0G7Q8_9ERIC|nr:ran guanine nucleotide release factor, putative [Actinidia rufa]
MPEDYCTERPLFGGAIDSTFPMRFQDVSNIRQVPDHQVFVDPARDESLIFELLDLKLDVADNGSATWFLQDLASEQDAEGAMVIEQSGVVEAGGLCFRNIPAIVTTAVGQMAISKGRQGREHKISICGKFASEGSCPLSESASTVGVGLPAPAAQSGSMPMAEVFKLAVSSFKVNDWSLFGAATG